ncbi:MAG: ABC transporter substrate-binding protein, partial [Dehalococcoidia bacterium]|nr:ABC transporter substrate-binding protein [Dehalococcoidia bacterium]
MVYRTGKVGVLLIAGILMTLLGIAACAPQAPVPTATKAAAPPATNTAQATAAPTSPAAPTQAAATPKPTAPPAALQVVKVADLGAMGETPFYIALEKGYFKEQGIDAKFERFSTGGDEVPPLATGELHVGGGTAGAGLFNSLARGLAIKAVAMKSRPEIPNDTNWWMVRSDLKDQIKTFADFKGRTVNMVSPAS